MKKANEKADPRRKRRAMTEVELAKLLDVARQRPLLDAMTVRRGARKGQLVANVRPEVRQKLGRLGRERALIYKTLVLTGLRRAELGSLTAGQLVLDCPMPYVVLRSEDEKNREGSEILVRPDLAAVAVSADSRSPALAIAGRGSAAIRLRMRGPPTPVLPRLYSSVPHKFNTIRSLKRCTI